MSEIRVMKPEDYDALLDLWTNSEGCGVGVDDTREYITNYLLRNPKTSFTAWDGDVLTGAIMAGHDGYRGFIHHTGVRTEYRGRGIGTALVQAALKALKQEKINKVVLVAFRTNDQGNAFWEKQGFAVREDLFYRDCRIG